MTCIVIMPTVLIKITRGPYEHMEGCIAFLKWLGTRVWEGPLGSSTPVPWVFQGPCKTWRALWPQEMIGRKGEVNTTANTVCSVQAGSTHRLILLHLQKNLKEVLNYKRSWQELFWFGFTPNSTEHKPFPLLCGCWVFVRRCGCLHEKPGTWL